MNSKILIVEDEAKIREILCDYFSSKGELPVEASNGMQALELIDENEFDAVLLDIMMPELDGLSVCRAVRRTNDVPIFSSPPFPTRRTNCWVMNSEQMTMLRSRLPCLCSMQNHGTHQA